MTFSHNLINFIGFDLLECGFHVDPKLIKFSDAVKFTMNVTSALWTIQVCVAIHPLFIGKCTPETTLALVVVRSNAS